MVISKGASGGWIPLLKAAFILGVQHSAYFALIFQKLKTNSVLFNNLMCCFQLCYDWILHFFMIIEIFHIVDYIFSLIKLNSHICIYENIGMVAAKYILLWCCTKSALVKIFRNHHCLYWYNNINLFKGYEPSIWWVSKNVKFYIWVFLINQLHHLKGILQKFIWKLQGHLFLNGNYTQL